MAPIHPPNNNPLPPLHSSPPPPPASENSDWCFVLLKAGDVFQSYTTSTRPTITLPLFPLPDYKADEHLTAESLFMSQSNGEANLEESSAVTDRPEARNRSYKCSTCGRVFETYQALGGHQTSHRIKPLFIDSLAAMSASDSAGMLHKCPVCDEIFFMGQALGGHMRKHYGGTIIRKGNGKRMRLNSSADSGGSARRTDDDDDDETRGRLNLDLSLAPPGQ